MRRALTLPEVLISLAAAAILIAALAPSLARVRSLGGESISFANLQTLSFAHALYAWDWNDRQVTWIPDDAGVYSSQSGTTNWYTAYVTGGGGCPPPILVGWDATVLPTLWGYFLPCGGFGSGSGGSYVAYQPCTFTPGNVFGSFRLANAMAFHNYVDGRFYSEAFYTPTDTKTWELASYGFPFDGTFTIPPPLGQGGLPSIVHTSYCLSPAAMFGPEVLGFNGESGGWYTAPWTSQTGFESPTVSSCAHPDLKTRMLEHNWNLGQPAATNPAFAGGYTPYFFNHGLDATPVTLFFDGHVQSLANSHVVADDATVLSGDGVGLWSRDTPLGTAGYFGNQSVDGTLVSHHILTVDGILGRDILSTTPPPAGVQQRPEHWQSHRSGEGTRSSKGSMVKPARPPGANPVGVPW
jgi:hypothetical protein